MALSPGSRLDPYEVTAKIGQGGMGEEYRMPFTQAVRKMGLMTSPAFLKSRP